MGAGKKSSKQTKTVQYEHDGTICEREFHDCQDGCNDLIPTLGNCKDCTEPYKHIKTVEDFHTGYLHYIYECGCVPGKRKAQIALKIIDADPKDKSDKDDYLKRFVQG